MVCVRIRMLYFATRTARARGLSDVFAWRKMKNVPLSLGIGITLLMASGQAIAQPTRDPATPGFVAANELADGSVPPTDAEGNFIVGPTHTPAAEMVAHEGVPHGAVHTFTMRSSDSEIFPGI